MFYSDTILARKGPLANIWLAAHWDRKLSKSQIISTDIPTSVKELTLAPASAFTLETNTGIKGKKATVQDDDEGVSSLPPMALRLRGQLLLGVVKIYWRKTRYLLDDCQEVVVKMRLAFAPSAAHFSSRLEKVNMTPFEGGLDRSKENQEPGSPRRLGSRASTDSHRLNDEEFEALLSQHTLKRTDPPGSPRFSPLRKRPISLFPLSLGTSSGSDKETNDDWPEFNISWEELADPDSVALWKSSQPASEGKLRGTNVGDSPHVPIADNIEIARRQAEEEIVPRLSSLEEEFRGELKGRDAAHRVSINGEEIGRESLGISLDENATLMDHSMTLNDEGMGFNEDNNIMNVDEPAKDASEEPGGLLFDSPRISFSGQDANKRRTLERLSSRKSDLTSKNDVQPLKTYSRTASKRRKLLVDATIEISGATIQQQLKDTTDIIMSNAALWRHSSLQTANTASLENALPLWLRINPVEDLNLWPSAPSSVIANSRIEELNTTSSIENVIEQDFGFQDELGLNTAQNDVLQADTTNEQDAVVPFSPLPIRDSLITATTSDVRDSVPAPADDNSISELDAVSSTQINPLTMNQSQTTMFTAIHPLDDFLQNTTHMGFVPFKEIIHHKKNRRVVSTTFFDCLAAASKNLISVQQRAPYQDISLQKMNVTVV